MAGRRWVQRVQLQGWLGLIIAIAGLIALPILAVVSTLFVPVDLAIWQHLLVTVLPRYIINSLALMIGVGVGVIGVGVGTAWLVTLCRFPGSRWLEWALLLPLAAPAYILAYVYTDVLDFYGPVQTTLRSLFGWSRATDYWFPEVRSLGGAIVMFILVLYPYVYLITRVAFLEQSTCVIEVSRSLGCNPWRSFFTVALPLARPAIAGGTALALMETLNDFGTVQFFGVETFSTGIYRTWFGMGERIAASQLAVVLLLFILGLLLLEQWSRRRTRYYQTNNNQRALSRYELRGWRSLGAVITCVLPLLLGFVVPAALLLEMSLTNLTERFSEGFWIYARHSLILAGLTAAIGVAFSLILAYGNRLYPNWLTLLSVRVAAIGYGVPGAVIAVGILVPLGWVDNTVDQWARQAWGVSTGLLLSGTIVALIFAYLVRFLAVSFNAVNASLSRVRPSLDDAARSLGYDTTQTLLNVHAPLISGGLLTGAILVFVDVMKELPATLIIRPFNFDTLAVQVYRLAADERLAEAAAPALAIVLVGMMPVILLSWQIQRSRQS